MSSIGIITALQSEAVSLSNLLAKKNIFHRVSGIGPSAAKKSANELCVNGCSALISFGYAGALNSTFRSGALVIGRSVSNGQETIDIKSSWLSKFNGIANRESTFAIYRASFLSTASPLLTKMQKADNNSEGNWSAVDMESFAVAEVARQYGVPILIIRAILDELDTIIPVGTTNIIDAKGRLKLFPTIYEVLKNPKDLQYYFTLAVARSKADRTLRRAAAIIARSGLV